MKTVLCEHVLVTSFKLRPPFKVYCNGPLSENYFIVLWDHFANSVDYGTKKLEGNYVCV